MNNKNVYTLNGGIAGSNQLTEIDDPLESLLSEFGPYEIDEDLSSVVDEVYSNDKSFICSKAEELSEKCPYCAIEDRIKELSELNKRLKFYASEIGSH